MPLLFILLLPLFRIVSCLEIVTPSSSSGRPLTLYQAPRPYRDGRPLNSVIITSKPMSMSRQPTSTTTTTTTTTEIPASLSNNDTQTPLQMDCIAGQPCSATVEFSTQTPSFKTYPPHLLEQLLKDYAQVRTAAPHTLEETRQRPMSHLTQTDPRMDGEEETTSRLASLVLDEPLPEDDDMIPIDNDDPEGKEERWSLISRPPSKHPYDDRHGWVTLEPVPWSNTKISKWHSSVPNVNRPSIETERPWYNNNNNNKPERPSAWYDKGDRPHPPPSSWYEKPERPWYEKIPSARPPWYDKNPDIEYPYEMQRPVSKPIPSRPDCNEINTDYGPPPWEEHRPSYSSSPHSPPRRHPANYPMMNDGQWVLLSSTKGYSLPQSRSLDIFPQPAGQVATKTTRGIKLTVLPSLKGKTNMTTSHGGLLEVESSFESISGSQMINNNKTTESNNLTKQQEVKIAESKYVPDRRTAMLAAVGAGMLPATMAMVVPLMLGRRRRRRELLNFPDAVDTQSQSRKSDNFVPVALNDDGGNKNREDRVWRPVDEFDDVVPRRRPWVDGCRAYGYNNNNRYPDRRRGDFSVKRTLIKLAN